MTEQVISIEGNSARDLANDVVSITLTASKTGAKAADVQSALREAVKDALTTVQPFLVDEQVEVTTDSFQVQPAYNKAGDKQTGYSGVASITLKGTDTATIAQLASDVKSMVVSSSQNSMSRKLKNSVEEELMQEAIVDFRTKADSIALAFGFKYWTLGQVSVSASSARNYGGGGKVFAMAAAVESAPMQVESGKSTMNGSCRGTIVLSKKKPT